MYEVSVFPPYILRFAYNVVVGISMAFIIPLILVAIYVSQLKAWIKGTKPVCWSQLKDKMLFHLGHRYFRQSNAMLRQVQRTHRHTVVDDVENGGAGPYHSSRFTSSSGETIHTSDINDSARSEGSYQRRRKS